MLTIQLSVAQNFTLTPSSINAFVRIDTPSIHEVLIINQLNTPIEMGWDLLSNTLPNTWDYLFLYNGSCCPASGMDPNGVLDSIPASGQGFLRLQLDPMFNSSTGTLKLWVYETNNPSFGDTVTYTIDASPMAIADAQGPVSFILYPNPVVDAIYLQSKDADIVTLRIFSYTGQRVKEEKIILSYEHPIDVSQLEPGMYFIQLISDQGVSTFQRFYKSN
jgi:hypothetical protein